MGHANKSEFLPVNIAVLTVSDSRIFENDRSGDTLVERLESAGHKLVARAIVKDEVPLISEQLKSWEKEIPGFGELFRWVSYQKIKTSTIQSRACAGVAGGTYMFALPGSTGACKDAWDEILHDQLDIRHKPCNFVEMIPRLTEHLD